MTARHFRISRTTTLPMGGVWRITEIEGAAGATIKEFPTGHKQRKALAALAYGLVAETPGPIVVHISDG